MPRSYRLDDDSDDGYVVLQSRPTRAQDTGRGRRLSPPETIVNNFLSIPENGGRRRAASSGGLAQPVNIIMEPVRDRPRSRSRHHSSSSESRSRSRSRSRTRHRSSSRRPYHPGRDYVDEADLPYSMRRDLDLGREAFDERRRERDREKEKERLRAELEMDKLKKKDEKERLIAELELDKQKKKAERERILMEARDAEAKQKKEEKELRERILLEEADKKRKDEEKKKKEEAEFEKRVREKFLAAGWSDREIDDVLHRKREERRRQDRELAIDVSRPTFIKVHRKYLHPDTLDAFRLPWEWDREDTNFIIIKKWIDHDFQEELFAHTKTLYSKKLITDGYTKETVVKTTLKPNDVHRDRDKMYVVREKSRSRSTSRVRPSSWMFT